MNKYSTKNGIDALNLNRLAYRDYLAARFLLLNDYLIQGATLSSSAIEKYLKIVLSIVGATEPVHLDRIKKLEKAFEKHKITILGELDPLYLNHLGKAYSLRYYDRIQGKKILSVHKWQSLAELDASVHRIESSINISRKDGSKFPTEYDNDCKSKSNHLLEQNHVLLKISKKEFMEREGLCAIISINRNSRELQSRFVGVSPVEYAGKFLQVDDFVIEDKKLTISYNQPAKLSEEAKKKPGIVRD